MDSKLLKILIQDAKDTVNNMQANTDNYSILKYFAAKLTVLSSEMLTCLNEK